MTPSFTFSNCAGEIHFDLVSAFALDKAVASLPQEELVLIQADRASPQFVMTSPSGSMQVVLGDRSATLAVGFFGGFEELNAWSERRDYLRKKLGILLPALEAGGVRLRMLGITLKALWYVPNGEIAAVKRAMQSLLDPQGVLSPDADFYDFALRASRRHGVEGFFNTSFSWVQTRNYSVRPLVSSGTNPGFVAQFRPWEGQLVQEGVELRFDLNNKQALFAGDDTWTADRLLQFFDRIMPECEPATRDAVAAVITAVERADIGRNAR